MLEKLDAQPRPFSRALDQPRNIGHDKAAQAINTNHAKVRMQSGKWVVRHLGTRIGDSADQRGLARIGQAEQADIRQHLQLQMQLALVAFRTMGALTRGAVGRAFETGVAQAMKAAARHQYALSGLHHITDQLLGIRIVNHGANRHGNLQILPFGAGHIAPSAILAALRVKAALEAEIRQRVQIRMPDHVHAAAITAITTIRPTHGDEFFAAKTGHAIAAVTGLDVNMRFVNEFHFSPRPKQTKPRQSGAGLRTV